MKPANTAQARLYWSQGHSGGVAEARCPERTVPSTIDLLGIHLHVVDEQRCVEHVIDHAVTGEGGWVVTPNLDILRRCARDESMAAIVARADLAVADGMPLVWASRLQQTPLPERVAGSSLISTLSAAAADHGLSVFLLGGAPGTAEAAAKVLQRRSSHLDIAGTYCPPVGFETNRIELATIEQRLLEAQPDIVFVALGFPKQERLIERMAYVLPHAWWLGVGISFSFLTGDVRRAPLWVQRTGLEWLHRLFQEPRRLGRRYLIHGLPFAATLLATSALRGLRR